MIALLGTLPLVAQQLTIGNYVKVSEQKVMEPKIKDNICLHTYRATLANGGPALAGATAVLYRTCHGDRRVPNQGPCAAS